jgi:hypothetical protein
MERILNQSNIRVIEADNVLRIIEKVGPWVGLEPVLENVAKTAIDIEVQHRASVLLSVASSKPITDESEYHYYMNLGLSILASEGRMNLKEELANLAEFQVRIQKLYIGGYPKSVLTFERSVKILVLLESWKKAIKHSHLGSVSSRSNEYQLMKKVMEEINGG